MCECCAGEEGDRSARDRAGEEGQPSLWVVLNLDCILHNFQAGQWPEDLGGITESRNQRAW